MLEQIKGDPWSLAAGFPGALPHFASTDAPGTLPSGAGRRLAQFAFPPPLGAPQGRLRVWW